MGVGRGYGDEVEEQLRCGGSGGVKGRGAGMLVL
jgi:hypothetical protein